jgi:hypothetical protein
MAVMSESNSKLLNDLPEHLLRRALPESMRDLLQFIPLDAVLKILEVYGGIRLYIPDRPVPDKGLGAIIGLEAAQSLASYAGSNWIQVPTLHKSKILARRASVLESLACGTSLTATARAFGMTSRNVSYIRSQYGK